MMQMTVQVDRVFEAMGLMTAAASKSKMLTAAMMVKGLRRRGAERSQERGKREVNRRRRQSA